MQSEFENKDERSRVRRDYEESLNRSRVVDREFEQVVKTSIRDVAAKRALFITTIGMCVAIMTLFVLTAVFRPSEFTLEKFLNPQRFIPIAGSLIGLISIALLAYLRDSGPASKSSNRLNARISELERALVNQSHLIKKELSNAFVSEGDRERILSEITSELRKTTVSSVVGELVDKNTAAQEEMAIFTNVKREHIETTDRLKGAISSLQNRANVNLVFGIALSLSGVLILWQTLALPSHGTSIPDFVESYLPRFSLVIIVEIFAYFFLNLYRANLAETRYYHNELTNISSRQKALACALKLPDSDIFNTILTELAKTERNNILNKGQTTVELAKARIESDSTKNLTGIVDKLIGALRPIKKE